MALAVERWLMQRFDIVSTISEKMMDRALKKGVASRERVPSAKLGRYPVDLSARPAKRSFSELGIAEDAKVVLYSGNMGAKQGGLTCSPMRLHRWPHARTSCSSSAATARQGRICNSAAPRCELPLHVPAPVERLNELLNLADIHVLSQRGDVADLVMPFQAHRHCSRAAGRWSRWRSRAPSSSTPCPRAA